MSVFDLIVLAILAVLTLRGIWKGMISQIVSIVSFFVCWIVATRFGSLIAPTIPLEAPWNQVTAMAIIFVITLIAIRFAYSILEKLIKHWHLEKLNTLFGGALGFTKGLLLCLILTFFSVMASETSRDIVFNSKSGFHLVRLISQIGVFIPKDSYEFVHTQLASFQDQVDKAVPGQMPETLPIQSSEAMQGMLANLRLTKEQPEPSANSLFTAISKWWNGADEDALPPALLSSSQDSAPSPTVRQLIAATYVPPMSIMPVNSSAAPQPPVASSPAVPLQNAVDPILSLFTERVTPPAVQEVFNELPTLTPFLTDRTALPAVQEIFNEPPALSQLSTLAPLTEALAILPEQESRILPKIAVPHHIGSDLLLRNSSRVSSPNASAKVFRDQ